MNAALTSLMPSQYVDRFRDTQADAAELAAGVATANRQAADQEAADNRVTAANTGALARTLATARRSPGGGIRMAGGRRGFNAAAAGGGLNRANASRRRESLVEEATARAGVSSLSRAQSNLSTYEDARRQAARNNAARGVITIYH